MYAAVPYVVVLRGPYPITRAISGGALKVETFLVPEMGRSKGIGIFVKKKFKF